MPGDSLNIVIRVMPSGEEYDVEMPRFYTGKQILDQLLESSIAPRMDQGGNPYAYDLIIKNSNILIEKNKSLDDLRVRDGDLILFIPNVVAGSFSV